MALATPQDVDKLVADTKKAFPGGNIPQVGAPGGNPPQVGNPGGNPPMVGKGKRELEEYVAPGIPLDQYIANQTPIHTAGDVRGRTPIHIVTN
jgi:hypothetical protein